MSKTSDKTKAQSAKATAAATEEATTEATPETTPETTDQTAMADEWAAALAQQEDGEVSGASAAAAEPEAASDKVFQPFEQEGGSAANHVRGLDMVMDIPVKLDVVLGRTRITIKQLLELTEGSVVELDGLAGDPLDILINGYLVAQGEVVVVDEKYGIRIIEIVNPSERIQKLNQ